MRNDAFTNIYTKKLNLLTFSCQLSNTSNHAKVLYHNNDLPVIKPNVATREPKFCTYAPARHPSAARLWPTMLTMRQPNLSTNTPQNIPRTKQEFFEELQLESPKKFQGVGHQNCGLQIYHNFS